MKRIYLMILSLIICLLVFVGCNTTTNNNEDIESEDDGVKNSNIVSNEGDKEKQYSSFIITDITDSNLIVAEIGEDGNALVTRQYKIPNWFDGTDVKIKIGDKITVVHNGEVTETEPTEFAEIYQMEYEDSHGCTICVIPQE